MNGQPLTRRFAPNPMGWMLPFATLALAAGILIGRSAVSLMFPSSALFLASAACFLGRDRVRRMAVLGVVACLGCVHGYFAYHPALPEEGVYTVSGLVAQEPDIAEDSKVTIRLQSISLDGQPLFSGAWWSFYPEKGESLPENLQPGSIVTFSARIYHPSDDATSGFSFREYLLQQGMRVGVWGQKELTVAPGKGVNAFIARLRHTLTQKLIHAMGEETGRFAATMLLGMRNLLPEEDEIAFRRLGIAHILSVSGYHTGVLAGILALFFRLLRLRRGLRTILTAAVLLAYCLLTGGNPPVIRASLLVLLFQLGRLQQRQNIGLHLLCTSAFIILLFSPVQLTSASFLLTYGAMLGITLVSPTLQRLYIPKSAWGQTLWKALSLSAGAQLGLLLPQLYCFQDMAPLSVLINLPVMAGASFLLGAYWLVLALLPLEAAACFVGGIVGFGSEKIMAMIRLVSPYLGLSLRTLPVNLLTCLGWISLMAGLTPYLKKRRWIPACTGIVLIIISLLPLPRTSVSYTQFSVGNADAALIEDGSVTIAIDTGEDRTLADHITGQCLSLDGLILTHLHSDHAGGLRYLLDEGVKIDTLYLPEGAMQADIDDGMAELVHALLETGTRFVTIGRGDVITLPSGSLTVLWPEKGKVRPRQEANLHSAALLLQLMDSTLLLTGDLDGTFERYAAEPADILKVAHHGSNYSTYPAFLEAVSPQALLLSCGDEEREDSILFRAGKLPVYSTYTLGSIRILFDQNGFTIHTQDITE